MRPAREGFKLGGFEMPKTTPAREALGVRLRKLVGRLISSRLAGWVANLPPIAWATRVVARTLAKRQIAKVPAQAALIERVAGIGLEATLQQIVYDVVNALGYMGAGVATYEPDDSLPLRAFYFDPNVVSEEQIHEWEVRGSEIMGRPFSLSDPEISRVYVHQDEFKDNLSLRAVKARGPVQSDELYDLFTPVVPLSAKPIVEGVQKALGIEQVISVPFFLETVVDGQPTKEIVGNLFAGKRGEISEQDVLILSAFGRQAATAIESERRRLQIQLAQELVFAMQTSLQDETQVLQRIVKGVTDDLGYMGAMVATYEPDGSLPLRAFYFDPNIVSEEQVHEWEAQVSKIMGKEVSLSDPDIAAVHVHKDEFKDNLSVQAFEAGGPVSTNEFYDLFRPVVPLSAKPIIQGIQEAVGVGQLIAVPFFLETVIDDKPTKEIVGNLFAGTRSKSFSSGEIEMLKAFGQQAAAGIRNARLYRKAEKGRIDGLKLSMMSTLSNLILHDLNSELGKIRLYTDDERVYQKVDTVLNMIERLTAPIKQEVKIEPTDVNASVVSVLEDMKKIPGDIEIVEDFTSDLPRVQASAHINEIFRILIKNAIEAMEEGGVLTIRTKMAEEDEKAEVLVTDTGRGIDEENMEKLFAPRFTTKRAKGSLGVGLYLAKNFLEMMNGEIKVESKVGKGTTFTVSLLTDVGKEAIRE
jgi:signal transduction histidine kinase